jgi:hypothetical protein
VLVSQVFDALRLTLLQSVHRLVIFGSFRIVILVVIQVLVVVVVLKQLLQALLTLGLIVLVASIV